MGINDNQSEKRVGGVAANRIAVPVIIMFIILHLLVIYLFVSISRESREMSAIMQRSGEYVSDVTDLLGGSSILSETSTNFILMPVSENGEINYSPLMAYAGELKNDRRGPQIEERFAEYDVSEEDLKYIAEASAAAQGMLDSQLHALALMNSVYRFSDVPALRSIPLPELSEKEKEYTDERKTAAARQLVLGTDYALNKQTVSQDVNACAGNIKKESGMKVAAEGEKVNRLRNWLWAVTVAIVLLLLFTFVIIYQQIIVPLNRIAEQIREDKPLQTIRGLKEVREVAYAYNGLLRRRDTLEDILRSAAETDTLTNLPNRYAFRQYLVESQEDGNALALLMFDVNYLKQTNDTLGHQAGDELLKKSAECIETCFGASGENNCFRLGGDEFAAVVKNPSEELIDNEIKMFKDEQKRRKISISWGIAMPDEMTGASVEELIETADRKMYERKKVMHKS